MSMDLKLVLVNNSGRGFRSLDVFLATNVLGLDQGYRLFGQINNEWMHQEGVKQASSSTRKEGGLPRRRMRTEIR